MLEYSRSGVDVSGGTCGDLKKLSEALGRMWRRAQSRILIEKMGFSDLEVSD